MKRRVAGAAVVVVAAVAVPACDAATELPANACDETVWFAVAASSTAPRPAVHVMGDFNGWARPGLALEPVAGRPEWAAKVPFLPGLDQRYVFVVDGAWVTDSYVGTTAFHEGREVSLRHVDDCNAPRLAQREWDGERLRLSFAPARAGAPLDPSSVTVRGVRPGAGEPWVPGHVVRGDEVEVDLSRAPSARVTLQVEARDRKGNVARGGPWPVWRKPRAADERDRIVYQIMVDRFAASDGTPLVPPQSPAGRAGGTLAGVTAALRSGYFDRLGVSTLWLSPLVENPEGEYPGADKMYSSYHGYWPQNPRAIDRRLGTEDDLSTLVDEAHARGVGVILDVVPNHVFSAHPYASKQGWVQGAPNSCLCGTPGCPWAENIQRCWFAPYLPDLDWRNEDAARQTVDDVRYWVERFHLDGVRVDAVPMMPLAATRRLAMVLRRSQNGPAHRSWLVGENFTGPGAFDLLRYHLGPDGLDTQFHFPLMWSLRQALAEDASPMSEISASVVAGERAWADASPRGGLPTMGLMVGNHDVARFITVAMGQAGGDGFVAAPEPSSAGPFERLWVAHALTLTLPGAPFLYYGDEIGLAGRLDPDSRRVMRWDAGGTASTRPSAQGVALRDKVGALGRLRACSRALRRGQFRLLYADRERILFAREITDPEEQVSGTDARAVVLAVRRAEFPTLQVAAPGVPPGRYVDALTGEAVDMTPELTKLGLAPFSVRVFLPEGATCLSRP